MPSNSSFFLPLKISENQRYLVDQHGEPVFIQGDAAWSLITAVTDEEVEQYLADREAKGFNALIVNLIEHKFFGPQTLDGLLPFGKMNRLSEPNEAYFNHARRVLERAASHGMVVFLAPLFLGYPNARSDEGWYHEARLSGPENLFRYGQYVGQKFADLDNIIWLIGCDRNTQGIEQEINSLVMGIKSGGAPHLFTAQPAPDEVTLDWYGGTRQGGWLDLNTCYTYQIVHKRLLAEYNRKPVMPYVLIESSYEGEHNCSAVQIRRQAYWAALCGACGQFFGNNPIWLFNPGWKAALDLEGSRSMAHFKSLFTSRNWYKLIPDQKHEVITAGLGEFNGLDYLAAARTDDGSCIMAYMPAARTIMVDLSKVAGEKACAWWFDPRTGQQTPAGEYLTGQPCTFTPPGDGDWALIIDTTQ
jgi:hypothetical protein